MKPAGSPRSSADCVQLLLFTSTCLKINTYIMTCRLVDVNSHCVSCTQVDVGMFICNNIPTLMPSF